MSFPLSIKNPILRAEFEKSENKIPKKKRFANSVLPKPRPMHYHPERIFGSQLKMPKLSYEELFKEEPHEIRGNNDQNHRNFFMTKKQVANFVATHNLMQKLQKNLLAKADESEQNQMKAGSHLQIKTHSDEAAQRVSQLKGEPAASRNVGCAQKLRVFTEESDSIGDFALSQTNASKTQATPKKLQPFILQSIGTQSLVTNSFSSPKALEGPNSFDFSKHEVSGSKSSNRKSEFIAIQKSKILGKGYTKLQKIRVIIANQKKILAQASTAMQKLEAITLDQPIETTKIHQSEDLESENRHHAIKVSVETTVSNLNRTMGLIGYDSLRDEHNFNSSNQIDSRYISSPLSFQFDHLRSSTIPDSGFNSNSEKLLNIKSNLGSRFVSSDNIESKAAKVSASEHIHTLVVNRFNSSKPKLEALTNTAEANSSVKKDRNQSGVQKSKGEAPKAFDDEFEQLSNKMFLAKEDSKNLRKILFRKKRVLNKSFKDLDRELHKLVIL